MTELFDFLVGISPWWWVGFGLLLGALEMATGSFFLIGPGAAAVIVGLAMFARPEMGGSAQIAIFAVISVALTWAARVYTAKAQETPSDRPGLNRRSSQVVGQRGRVKDAFSHGQGAVEIRGVRWLAKLADGEDLPEGAPVEVVSAEGVTLVVKAV